MGRSPILILTCLSAMSLGADNITDTAADALTDAPAPVIFDASDYLRRMGGVEISSLPTLSSPATLDLPAASPQPVQSVPLPPAVMGTLTLGAGWLLVRGTRAVRRHVRPRR